MKYMENRVFVDTNIWIYGLTESDLETDKNKRKISLNLFENILAEGRSIYISVQVINECHWNFIKKFKLSDNLAVKGIQENVIPISNIVSMSLSTYMTANDLRSKHNFSYWDSLIVASALENACEVLYTEDLQDGHVIEGRLRIVNPFK
jgi:predicted nucleic acid-binding protein